MKTRQSKLKLNKITKSNDIDENTCSKEVLNRNSSYECILDDIFDEPKCIPRLIIRKKSRKIINESNVKLIQFIDKKDIPKPTLTLSNEMVTPLVNINHKSSHIENEVIAKLLDSVISQHLSHCSKYSKFIDCKNIYEDFLKNVKLNRNTCWTDLYAPKKAENILTSKISEILKFKKWLETWKMSTKKKIKKRAFKDNSDFEENSFDLHEKPRCSPAICVITGLSGAGKSSLVYSIACELNYQIFEVNCSTKRTGKDILDKLESASENKHVKLKRVTETNETSISPKNNKRKLSSDFFETISKKPKNEITMKRQNSNISIESRSLFLFDDVDVVMEEDKGFSSAISTLIEKKTRPIILTSTDSIELDKFLNKLGKATYITINLQRECLSDIAVYLQLVLMSRGSIVNHVDMLEWIYSFSSPTIPDLRHCLNNLQFNYVNKQLPLTRRLDFINWSHYKLNSISFSDTSSENGDRNGNVEDKRQDEIVAISDDRELMKSKCSQALKCISSQLYKLSVIDSRMRIVDECQKTIERNSTIDKMSNSYYNSNNTLSSEIATTMTSLYNKTLHQSLTTFETDILYTSSSSEYNKIVKPKHFPNPFRIDLQNRVVGSINVKSAVFGVSDHLDRLSALRTMASFENNRKSNYKQRRFTHYFDRAHFRINESDIKYLATSFKDI